MKKMEKPMLKGGTRVGQNSMFKGPAKMMPRGGISQGRVKVKQKHPYSKLLQYEYTKKGGTRVGQNGHMSAHNPNMMGRKLARMGKKASANSY